MAVHLYYSIVYLDLVAQVCRTALADALHEDARQLLCNRNEVKVVTTWQKKYYILTQVPNTVFGIFLYFRSFEIRKLRNCEFINFQIYKRRNLRMFEASKTSNSRIFVLRNLSVLNL